MVFLIWAMVFPASSTSKLAGLALITSLLDEFSQMYHAPWIDAIRRTTIGHLILGTDFAWADIAAYVLGIAAVAAVDAIGRRRLTNPST